jgi:hypothetical protein
MRAVHDDDTDRSSDLADVRTRIADMEGKLHDVNVQLIWDAAVRELHLHQAWKQLVERMVGYRTLAVDQLASRRLDSYELGMVQGRLAMLRILTQTQPIPIEQLDKIQQFAKDLEAQLEEDRSLLR